MSELHEGQRIGHLILIKIEKPKRVQELSHKCGIWWKCVCDCGEITHRRKGDLNIAIREGQATTCGCGTWYATIAGLLHTPGAHVGALVVLGDTGKRDSANRTTWRCRCECGALTYKSSQSIYDALQAGTQMSCGRCGYDLRGREFGWLRAIERLSGQGGKAEWRCVCGCGQYVTKKASTLLQMKRDGFMSSCGCQGRFPGGTKRAASDGYVEIWAPGHPNARKGRAKRGTILEHIYVMSQYIGRPIKMDEGEVVHHINGNKADNRIENLELCCKGKHKHPPGQRAVDLVRYAREILNEYGDLYPIDVQ